MQKNSLSGAGTERRKIPLFTTKSKIQGQRTTTLAKVIANVRESGQGI